MLAGFAGRELSRKASTLSFDLDAALRRFNKPQKRNVPPPKRPDTELPWVDDAPLIGAALLLDTTVYVDVLHGRTPVAVDRLLQYRTCNHSSVALAELTHAFGRLNPAHPDTKPTLAQIRGMITQDIPSHRLFAPDMEIFGAAGILAGLIFRLLGYPKKQGLERKALNDALIFLQARELGCAVLTRNTADFDLLNRIDPGGQILLYR